MEDLTRLGIIFVIMLGGIGLGWFYSWNYRVKPLKKTIRDLRSVENIEMEVINGRIVGRKTEWPASAEEYLNFHSLEREDGIIEITFDGLESHLDHFAVHLLTRQKRDFMKMLKQTKTKQEIIEQCAKS